ncbi:CYFA0S05e00144g1_1 [Cyberlindnera fabianii]|uniref:Protein disulfide-isomerase n=2 Tax=Cyberlindnera fabianii TaxID=36022 RepID=A0A061ARV6_CYBFA|nr:CYFA0S05e00144g1_1 [Cyberlindnera fabianii]
MTYAYVRNAWYAHPRLPPKKSRRGHVSKMDRLEITPLAIFYPLSTHGLLPLPHTHIPTMRFLSALSIKSLSVLLAAVASVHAAGEEAAIASDDSAVVKLSAETFSDFIAANPLVLAEFFAPWCGHCKALGPNFAEAADELSPKEIKLAQIDCTQHQGLCSDHGIRGYPTLKVFRGSEDAVSDYEGPRSADGIVKYMLKQSLPAVSVFEDLTKLESFIAEAGSSVIVETGVKDNATFSDFANLHRDEFIFAQSTSADVAKKYGENKILVFFDGLEDPAVFAGDEVTAETLAEFIASESFPYFGELDSNTYQKYMSNPTPLAYLFYTSAEEREEYAPLIKELAKENRGKINFVGIEAARFGRHAENLNMKQEFPAFALHDATNNKKYGVNQDSALTPQAVKDFVKKFIAGEAEAIVKTEDIPEVQENAVYKIVGKTHDEIINDESRDVLVKYYAPWCGHCKRLAPTFEELAELYQNDKDAAAKVRIANVDATLNDVDVEITGYPTLILYPAGDKSNPIVHKGGRDLQSLIAFIKENGTNGVDGNELEAPAKKEGESKEENVHDEL